MTKKDAGGDGWRFLGECDPVEWSGSPRPRMSGQSVRCKLDLDQLDLRFIPSSPPSRQGHYSIHTRTAYAPATANVAPSCLAVAGIAQVAGLVECSCAAVRGMLFASHKRVHQRMLTCPPSPPPPTRRPPSAISCDPPPRLSLRLQHLLSLHLPSRAILCRHRPDDSSAERSLSKTTWQRIL